MRAEKMHACTQWLVWKDNSQVIYSNIFIYLKFYIVLEADMT